MIKYSKPNIIAEIGCNHKGDLDIAKELILLAKTSGSDVAKFQKRNSKELLPESQYNAPHPNSINSYGKTYGEHREFLEFSKLIPLKLNKEVKMNKDKIKIIIVKKYLFISSLFVLVLVKETLFK